MKLLVAAIWPPDSSEEALPVIAWGSPASCAEWPSGLLRLSVTTCHQNTMAASEAPAYTYVCMYSGLHLPPRQALLGQLSGLGRHGIPRRPRRCERLQVEDLARLSFKRQPLYVGVDDRQDAATREGLEQGYCVAPSAQRFLLLFTFLKKNASKKVPLLHHIAHIRPMRHTPRLCARIDATTSLWSCVDLGAPFVAVQVQRSCD